VVLVARTGEEPSRIATPAAAADVDPQSEAKPTRRQNSHSSEIECRARGGDSATAYEEDAITCSGCAETFNAIVMT